jgi:DNA-binding NtrC family response regulator
VRQLINMVHNAVCNADSRVLDIKDFPELTPAPAVRREIVRKIGSSQFALHGIFNGFPTICDVESLLVEEAIVFSNGSKSAAAKMLGLSRPTLMKKLDNGPLKNGMEVNYDDVI